MPRIDVALAQRLESLTGEEAACCVADYKAELRALQRSTAYQDGLRRAKALGDEKRYAALAMIEARGEMCACEVQAALGLTHATVSHHMAALAEAGLVIAERRGKWVHYRSTRGR